MATTAKSRVAETSTTTGTGNYTLAGAFASYYRRFQDAYTAGAAMFVPYVAYMGTNYEYGIGLLSANTTLQRTKVIESSNANAAVNWGAGTKVIMSALGANSGPFGKHNFDATTDPTTSDGLDEGYGRGSLWLKTATVAGVEQTILFMCVDDGNSVGGTARWVECGTKLVSQGWTNASRAQNSLHLGAGLNLLTSLSIWNNIAMGDGGLFMYENSLGFGLGWSPNQSTEGGHQWITAGAVGETTNATPQIIYNYDDNNYHFYIPESSVVSVTGRITARNNADNDVSVWEVDCTISRDGSANPTIVGGGTPTMIHQTAGAATWAVSLGINNTEDSVEVTVTGEAAKTIRWTARLSFDSTAFT